jgi:uncharacterized protein YecE (DUF72 family)
LKNPGLHIGTSGWSYKHWKGIFYPEETRPEKYLEFYSVHFDCVELNSCFYHLPLKKTVSGWMDRTNEKFRFCLKMSRLITHQLHLANTDVPLCNFFQVFEEMKERIGPVLIQLPPGLSFDYSLISDFLRLIGKMGSIFRFAVEIRNRSWVNDRFFDLLAQNNLAFVIADSGQRFPQSEIVTTDFVYLRFHGREHLYASDYTEDVLQEYGEKISSWLDSGIEIWAFFNNDYYGYAVKNALRLREVVEFR